MKLSHLFFIFIFVSVLLVACTRQSEPSQQIEPSVSPDAGSASVPGTTDASPAASAERPVRPVKEFDVTVKQWAFEPDTITVNKGDHVILHFTSIDVRHGVAIPEFDVENVDLPVGETKTVEFEADKTGVFNGMFCTVPCGKGHSQMQATIVVNP